MVHRVPLLGSAAGAFSIAAALMCMIYALGSISGEICHLQERLQTKRKTGAKRRNTAPLMSCPACSFRMEHGGTRDLW
eukprot:6112905-Amphidinium_carterae.1